MPQLNTDKIIKDLEKIFKVALREGNLTIALKAKESQSKILFSQKGTESSLADSNAPILLEKLTDTQIKNLLQA